MVSHQKYTNTTIACWCAGIIGPHVLRIHHIDVGFVSNPHTEAYGAIWGHMGPYAKPNWSVRPEGDWASCSNLMAAKCPSPARKCLNLASKTSESNSGLFRVMINSTSQISHINEYLRTVCWYRLCLLCTRLRTVAGLQSHQQHSGLPFCEAASNTGIDWKWDAWRMMKDDEGD